MKSLRQLTSLSLFSLCATFALTTTVAYAGPPPPPPAGGAPPPPAEGTPGAPPPPSGGNAAVPPSASPLNSAPPTGKLKSAEDQYKGNKFDQAAMAFAEAAGQQIPGDTPRAQFWLGKSLYKLGFFASSLSVFGEIVAAGIDVAAAQFGLVGKPDGVHKEVEAAPLAAQSIKHRID